jgi:hypothetical protein
MLTTYLRPDLRLRTRISGVIPLFLLYAFKSLTERLPLPLYFRCQFRLERLPHIYSWGWTIDPAVYSSKSSPPPQPPRSIKNQVRPHSEDQFLCTATCQSKLIASQAKMQHPIQVTRSYIWRSNWEPTNIWGPTYKIQSRRICTPLCKAGNVLKILKCRWVIG